MLSEFLPPLVLELKGRAGELLTSLKGVQAEVAKTEKAANQATTGIDHNMQVWSKVGKYATVGIASAAIAVGGYSVKMAADFQKASLRLVTDAGESQKNLKMVQAGMLDLSAQTGTSAADIAKGMYLVESAGYHGASGLLVMKSAAEAAKIGGADLTTVSDALTTAMTDYNFPASQASTVTSKLIATVGQGKTTMEALAGSLHNVLPQSSALHIQFDQVAGAMATMTAEGVSADQASQNLNHAILSLANPTQVQTKEMAAMGLNSTVVAQQLGKKGLTGTLDTLVTAITSHMGPAGTVLMDTFSHSKLAAQSAATEYQGLGKGAQQLATQYMNGTITLKEWTTGVKAMSPVQAGLAKTWAASYQASQAFNTSLQSNQGSAQTFTAALAKMTGGQQGLSVALHLTGDHAAAFANNVKVVGAASSEAGGHVRGWKDTQQLLTTQLDQMRASLNKAAIQLGSALIPAVQNAIKIGTQFTGWLVKNPPLLIGLATVIGGVLGSAILTYIARITIAGVKSAITFATMTAGAIKWAVTTAAQLAMASAKWVASSAVTIGSLIAQNAAMIAQKAIMIGGAVAMGIVTAAQWAWNVAMDANPIGLIIIAIAALVAAIIFLVTHWKQVTEFITQAWNNVGKFFQTVGNAIAAWWKGFWNGIVNFVTSVVSNVLNWIKGNWGLLLSFLIGPLGLAIQWIVNHWSQIVGFFQAVGNTIAAWWNGFWNGISQFAVSVFTGYVSWLQSIWGGIVGFFQTVGGAISNAWNGLWNGLGDIVRSAFDGIVGFITGVMNSVIDVINGVIGSINGALSAGKAVGINVSIPTVPHFADGGVMPYSGYALVGEAGPELVQLPAGARVFPNGQTPPGMNSLPSHADTGTQKSYTFNNTFNTNASASQITAEQGWLMKLYG